MDWFLYDGDLRHERVNSGNQLAKFGETLQLRPQFVDTLFIVRRAHALIQR